MRGRSPIKLFLNELPKVNMSRVSRVGVSFDIVCLLVRCWWRGTYSLRKHGSFTGVPYVSFLFIALVTQEWMFVYKCSCFMISLSRLRLSRRSGWFLC